MEHSEEATSRGTVTIVTSSGCHLCELAKDVVNSVAGDHRLSVRIVDLMSPEGTRLATTHRMPFPPLILVNGQLHGHGRVSEKKLRRFVESNRPSIRTER